MLKRQECKIQYFRIEFKMKKSKKALRKEDK